MDQTREKTPPFDGNGFTVAAVAAPGMALAIFYLGTSLTESSNGPGDIGTFIGSFLVLLLIATIWGAVPSLIFGVLVLAVIRRITWSGRPTAGVFAIGGAAAAGLYALTGLGVAGLSPGVAMFFAPWATPDLGALNMSDGGWWLVASLLLAGAGAGLIYAAIAKRG